MMLVQLLTIEAVACRTSATARGRATGFAAERLVDEHLLLMRVARGGSLGRAGAARARDAPDRPAAGHFRAGAAG